MVETGSQYHTDSNTLDSLLNSIPFEKCEYTFNPMTEEGCWKAPESWAFRLRGQFWVHQLCPMAVMFNYRPMESGEVVKADNPEKFAEYLRRFEGNEKLACNHLVADMYDDLYKEIPWEFSGQFLHIQQRLLRNSTPVPELKLPVDPYEFSYHLSVRSNINYQICDRYSPIRLDPDNPNSVEVYYEVANGGIYWEQDEAEAVLKRSTIDMIPYREEAPTLYVPRPAPIDKLYLAGGINNTLSRLQIGWEYFSGKKLSAERLRHFASLARESGDPYYDDPLKNFVFSKPPRTELQKSSKLYIPSKKQLDDPQDEYLKF